MEFRLKRCRLPEANIQAECYHRLRQLGIKSCLEYKHDHCRFDMVVLKGTEIIAIVEFKNRKDRNAVVNKNSRQYLRYSKYGVPVIYCMHRLEIDKTVEAIKSLF